MMEDLKTFFKKSLKKHIKVNSKFLKFGMSIDLLMIWLLIALKAKEDSYGLAKITMVTFNLI